MKGTGGPVAVLGGGSWGTVLGMLAAARCDEVRVWCRDPELADGTEQSRVNTRYLPGVVLPPQVRFTCDAQAALHEAGLVVLALPTQVLREVARSVRDLMRPGAIVASASKGLERGTFCRGSQILAQELAGPARERIAVISGPNLAREMAAGKPTGAVVASASEAVARAVQQRLSTPVFRLYSSSDVAGVEFGGALKNVIAIGAGIVHGLGLGDNALGALLTRGLAEMARLGVRQGARPLTFNGLSGVGDLVTTCASPLSRNRCVGEGIARGERLDEILRGLGMVAEGVPTTAAARALALAQRVEMPIAEAIHSVLFEGKDARSAVIELMSRDLRSEEEFG